MSKLIDTLNQQLKNPQYKKDAEDCIKLYNWIKETDPQKIVWSSRWDPLVDTIYKGFPSSEKRYKPTITGYAVLKGIDQ